MALIRGFSQVEEVGWEAQLHGGEPEGPLLVDIDEPRKDCKIDIPTHIRKLADFLPGYAIEYEVIRLKETNRRPHVVFHRPDHPPWVSLMEAVFLRGVTVMNEAGTLLLPQELLEEAKIQPVELLELKVLGPRGLHWLVAHNRGRYYFLGRGAWGKEGVLQREKRMKKKGVLVKTGEKRKTWPTTPLEY